MLKELLVSDVRVNLIKFMVKNFKDEFHVRALGRELGVEINAIRRELEKLTGLNLLLKKPWGNKIYYRINIDSTYYQDLLTLVYKEEGICKKLHSSLSHLGNIKFIAISKEYVMGRPVNSLELDLMIVGNPNLTYLENLISGYEKEHREINYSVLSEEDFINRKKKADSFAIKFLIQPKIMVFGDEVSFCKLI